MILLDTHIWIWWVTNSPQLKDEHVQLIQRFQTTGLGISIISCWEIAKLVEKERLQLALPVEEWLEQALAYPSIDLLHLTPRIVIESTQLPGAFHRDPADQLIVATARVLSLPLLTADRKIVAYPHVELASLP